MRILCVVLFLETAVCAMEESPKNPTLVKIAQHGNSFLTLLKSIPDAVREALPSVLQDSSGSEEEASKESPPKTRLHEAVQLDLIMADRPTFFHIQNKSQAIVHLVVILTAPLRPKRYFLQPTYGMMMLAPNNAEFQQLLVLQSEDNTHMAEYAFTSSSFVKLVIEHDMYIKNQLRICKQIEY